MFRSAKDSSRVVIDRDSQAEACCLESQGLTIALFCGIGGIGVLDTFVKSIGVGCQECASRVALTWDSYLE